MGFLDKFKGKAVDAVDKHGDKISGGLDKAGDMLDKRTKGKYTDKIQSGRAKVDEGMTKLDKSGGDITRSDRATSYTTPTPPPSDAIPPPVPTGGSVHTDPATFDTPSSQPSVDDSTQPGRDDSTLPPAAPTYPQQ